MRKLLYTTTALVGAAFLMEAAPAKAEVNLAARYNAQAVFGTKQAFEKSTDSKAKDAKNGRSSHFIDGARVDFSASKDHPNGLTTGFFSRMTMDGDKGNDNAEAAFDDVYGTIGGAFGTIYLGSVGDAGDSTHVGGTPGTTHFGVGESRIGDAGIGTGAVNSITGRQQSIKYISPSFTGFSFGASYAPETGGKRDGIDAPGDYNDAFAVGVAYTNSFAGTSISLSAGFGQTDSQPKTFDQAYGVTDTNIATSKLGTELRKLYIDSGGGSEVGLIQTALSEAEITNVIVRGSGDGAGNVDNGSTVARIDDLAELDALREGKVRDEGGDAFTFGAEIGYQDFKFGGSWGQHEKGQAETTAWRLGGSYTVDAFTFGIGYGQKETQNGAYVIGGAADSSGDITGTTLSYDANAGPLDEEESLAFTVDYALGDGANIDFGIEVDEKTSTAHRNVPAASDSAKSGRWKRTSYDETIFGVGVTLSF